MLGDYFIILFDEGVIVAGDNILSYYLFRFIRYLRILQRNLMRDWATYNLDLIVIEDEM